MERNVCISCNIIKCNYNTLQNFVLPSTGLFVIYSVINRDESQQCYTVYIYIHIYRIPLSNFNCGSPLIKTMLNVSCNDAINNKVFACAPA